MPEPLPATVVRPTRSNLALRVLTAVVAAPLILLGLYFGPLEAWYGFLLVSIGVAGWEFFKMTHRDDLVARLAGVGLCATTSLVFYLRWDDPRALMTLALGLPLAAIALGLARLGDISTAAVRMTATVFGPLWISTLTCLALMRKQLGPAGPGFVVLSLMFAWFADTGGYFSGRLFGRHKLYPAVSPKKTVEGFLGALGGACLGAALAHYWYLPSLPLGEGLVLAVFVGAAGQAGDLGESLLKRAVGVKDSGEIVPGHGGVLDRIDALFVTSALVYLYTRWR